MTDPDAPDPATMMTNAGAGTMPTDRPEHIAEIGVVNHPITGELIELPSFEQMAGQGLEKVTARDILIPRLAILQTLSDQMKRTHGSFIEDARVGDICDTGTNELMPSPLHLLPVVYDKLWIEWFPRATRKGIANVHVTDEIMAHTKPDAKGRPMLSNGNYIAETAQMYVLNLSAGRRPSFVPFSSTQLRKSRRWVTLASGEKQTTKAGVEYTPPLLYRSYLLTSVMESNNEGEWAGWVINRGPALPDLPNWRNILRDAITFRDQVKAGALRVDAAAAMTDDPSTINERGEEVDATKGPGDKPGDEPLKTGVRM